MNSKPAFSFAKRPFIVGVLVFSGLLVLTQLISYQDYLLLKSSKYKEQINAADLAKEKLEKALANSLSATQTLSFIVKKYGINEDFEVVGKQILESNHYVDAVELLKGGVITNVYPLKGNESVIGYDILKDTTRNIEALKAIEKRDLFFAGPFHLKQGGVSIVGRLPIFIDGKFWGFAVTLVKLSTLINAAGLDTAGDGDFAFQLSKINPETRKEEFFMPDSQRFNKSIAASVFVPSGEWRIYVMPKHSQTWLSFLPFSLLGFLLSVTGGMFAFFITRQPIRLKKLVDKQSLAIRKNEENYRNTLNRVSDAFASIDENWRISYMNQKAGDIFKRDPSQVIGKNIWEEFEITTDKQMYRTFHKAMEEQKYIYEDRFIERLNSWVEIFVYPSPNGLSVFFRDISNRKSAEMALKESEHRYKQLIEEMPEAIFTCDADGMVILYNKAAEQLLGTPPKHSTEPLGVQAKIYDNKGRRLTPKEYPTAVCLREGKQIFAMEVTIERIDGVKRQVLAHPSPIFNEAGKLSGAVNIIIDITERKAAEEKADREKNLSDAIINSLPGVFYLYNKEGKFLRWNKNFEIISGYTSEEISSMHPLDFFDNDEKELVQQRIGEVFITGMSDVEANLYTKNKEKIPFYFNGYTANFEGEECLIGMGIDITKRKIAEQGIKESEEKYRYLFNNNPALIFIWCLEDLSIMELNQTALEEYGYNRDEIFKLTVLDLRPAEDYQKIREFAANLLNNNVPQVRATWRHIKKNGELMMMDITSHRITYNHKPAVLSIAENVTQKLLTEEQLKKSYEDIRLLNTHLQTIREEERAGIAREIHDELGQQLTALKMDVSWINKKIHTDNAELQERISGMLLLIDQTVKIVRRIASDLRPGILDDLGLIAALEWQLGEFEKRMGIKTTFHSQIHNLDLEKKITIGLFRVYQEALTNIARHSEATSIEVIVDQVDDTLCLTIRDNGKGFEAEQIKFKNTLGLLGMTERVRMLNGELNIESNPGKGTSVIIKVPIKVFA